MTNKSVPQADVSNLLTVVITSSPTPSAPSTELISAVLKSFLAQCPSLIHCRVIVVFDHYDQVVAKPRLKKGQISLAQAEAYTGYKHNVKELVNRTFAAAASRQAPPCISTQVEAEFGSPFDSIKKNSVTVDVNSTPDDQITFVEPQQRLGFGLAVRTALRIATTPYVWIHQHDWTLELPVPIMAMLEVMEMFKNDSTVPVRYICLPSCRMLDYAVSDHVTKYPKLLTITRLLERDFATSSGDVVPLTPIYFWHDKPHIVQREHYLAKVFPTRLAIARGAFIEDSIGQRARNQMKEGQWAAWACWLLYPPVLETPFIRHIRGRTWRGEEATKLLIEKQKGEAWQKGGRRKKMNEAAALKREMDRLSLSDK